MYRIFDICIASELDLPGLAACDCEIPGWTITLPQGAPCDDGYDWFHSWDSPDGQARMSCARRGNTYLLDLMGMARFRISFDRRVIEAYPQVSCTNATLAHFLQDQVIPRVVSHAGRVVIHASAVTLKDGRTVVFTGPSGRGKSTLASAFYRAGHRLVTDDCLLLENRDGVVSAVAAYPSLRLWQDSAAELTAGSVADTRFSDMAHYSHKKQLVFEPAEGLASSEWLKLSAMFVLGEPPVSDDSRHIRIKPLGGNLTIMAMIESLFALDVVERESVKQNFEAVRGVAGSLPVFQLDYPRVYEILPEVIDYLAGVNHQNP